MSFYINVYLIIFINLYNNFQKTVLGNLYKQNNSKIFTEKWDVEKNNSVPFRVDCTIVSTFICLASVNKFLQQPIHLKNRRLAFPFFCRKEENSIEKIRIEIGSLMKKETRTHIIASAFIPTCLLNRSQLNLCIGTFTCVLFHFLHFLTKGIAFLQQFETWGRQKLSINNILIFSSHFFSRGGARHRLLHLPSMVFFQFVSQQFCCFCQQFCCFCQQFCISRQLSRFLQIFYIFCFCISATEQKSHFHGAANCHK